MNDNRYNAIPRDEHFRSEYRRIFGERKPVEGGRYTDAKPSAGGRVVFRQFTPYYHVGLGKMVTGRKDLERKLREAGAVEVGTESLDTFKRESIKVNGSKTWGDL